MAMDPPAYTAPSAAAPTRSHRSISDLRSQIIANTSVLHPSRNDERSRADHIEVVVARLPDPSAPDSYPDEKVVPRAQATTVIPAESSSAANAGKHYALLIRRSLSRTEVNIIFRCAPQDTTELALEQILLETERLMHLHVVQYGKAAKDGCVVM